MKLDSIVFWCGVTTAILKKVDFFDAKCGSIDLTGITISKILELYHRRNLNPLKLTSCYLDRINRMNPSLNAVIEINPDVLEIAKNFNILFNTQGINLPLFGIPVLIQDDYATYDKMETTSGTKELIGKKPKADASLVKQLREAGAIILGKTNPSEMSGFGFDYQGYSSRGGKIINPFNSQNPVYGASSGAAVALATSMATVVFGNSMLGGISGPASALGLIGFNPTKGFILTDGLISSSESMKNIGFMAKNMEDIMLLTEILSPRSSFQKNDNKNFFSKDLKIGMVNSPFFTHSSVKEQKASLDNVFTQFQNNGLDTIELKIDLNEGYFNKILNGAFYEYEEEMNKYIANNITEAKYSHIIHTAKSIVNLYEKNPSPRFSTEKLSHFIKLSEKDKKARYKDFLDLKTNFTNYFEKVMKEKELDLIVLPSQPETYSTLIPSILGVPMISMPIGTTLSGHFGLSFFTRRENDEILLELADALEKMLLKRQKNSLSSFYG